VPTAIPSFEESLAELNDLVGRLESGGLGLAASIAAYERGVSLLTRLHGQLADVEERVRLLVRIDDEGRPILEQPAGPPLPDADAVEATRPPRSPPRGAGRTGRVKRLPGMDEAGDAV
jgi:exodeoxyribonuclease VII small subunit